MREGGAEGVPRASQRPESRLSRWTGCRSSCAGCGKPEGGRGGVYVRVWSSVRTFRKYIGDAVVVDYGRDADVCTTVYRVAPSRPYP